MTTPRPSSASATRRQRPSSAIFLGSPSTLPDLPDLPSSPVSSGLPSPPETAASTGSGDERRQKRASTSSLASLNGVRARRTPQMHNGSGSGGSSSEARSRTISRSRSPSEHSEDGDEGNDEDHTAKLSDDRRLAASSNANMEETEGSSALQRVKSLAQGRRSVLSKLGSISSGSRLSTHSPLARLSRPPTPSDTSRISKDSRRAIVTRSLSRASGSETERDRAQFDGHSSSEDLSETPTSTTSSHFRSQSVRERRATVSDNERIRIPLADVQTTSATQRRTESRSSGDIEAAALAAVANSRRITPPDARRRQPLPREFRSSIASLNGFSLPEPPRTPRRDRGSPGLYSNQGSPSSHAATLHDSPNSPRSKPRYSTVREFTRKHQTRWLSQDLDSPPRGLPDEDGRPQRRRGGSGESPLVTASGRSVIGESLRAAGLARRRDDGDIFSENEASRRLRLTSDLGTRPAVARPDSRIGNDRPMTADGFAPQEYRTPPNATLGQRTARTVHVDRVDRPSTSLATYREEPRTAPPLLRTYKSSYGLPDNERLTRESGAESISRPLSRTRMAYPISSVANDERSASSLGHRTRPVSAQINHASESAGAEATPEHARLMLESLSLFESQLARLPAMGSTTTVTIPELFRSAQNIVHATNTLNDMLRGGTARALEQQIDAELSDEGQTIDLVGLWRDVGSEYRESMRVSDELVRTMTSFLLGVGKVLRETAAEKPHSRTISLDETASRRLTPDQTFSTGRKSEGRMSSDGGSSRPDGRRRWENSSGEMGGTMTSFTSQHSSHPSVPSSSSRSSKAQDNTEANVLRAPNKDSEPATVARKLARLSLTASRRQDSLQSLRDSLARESAQLKEADLSAAYADQVDSPLSAFSRRQDVPRRSNTIAAAPTLPTLPSESLITRRATVKATTISRRPKTSNGSGASSRVGPSMFPALSTFGEPTTAVSTTSAQASPERPRASGLTARTFSRASGAALAGLQQQMERDRDAAAARRRTTSASSALESEIARKATRGYESEQPEVRVGRGSLDSNRDRERDVAAGRERRTTMTGIFNRA